MPVHVSSTVVLIIRSSKIVLFVFIICIIIIIIIIIINCIIQHLVSSHSVGGRPMRRLREDLCTGRPPTEGDDTKCCIIQFWPPDDERNSARNT